MGEYIYRESFSQKALSPMAELIIKRIPEGISKNIFCEADLLCHYVAVLDNLSWFPITYIYKTDRKFELFERLISQRHFDKVKILFNVKDTEELKMKLIKIQQANLNQFGIGYSQSFDRVTAIYELIDIEKIGTTR